MKIFSETETKNIQGIPVNALDEPIQMLPPGTEEIHLNPEYVGNFMANFLGVMNGWTGVTTVCDVANGIAYSRFEVVLRSVSDESEHLCRIATGYCYNPTQPTFDSRYFIVDANGQRLIFSFGEKNRDGLVPLLIAQDADNMPDVSLNGHINGNGHLRPGLMGEPGIKYTSISRLMDTDYEWKVISTPDFTPQSETQ